MPTHACVPPASFSSVDIQDSFFINIQQWIWGETQLKTGVLFYRNRRRNNRKIRKSEITNHTMLHHAASKSNSITDTSPSMAQYKTKRGYHAIKQVPQNTKSRRRRATSLQTERAGWVNCARGEGAWRATNANGTKREREMIVVLGRTLDPTETIAKPRTGVRSVPNIRTPKLRVAFVGFSSMYSP